jgi:hypothetical protein
LNTVVIYKVSPSCWLNVPFDGKLQQKTTMCSACKDRPNKFFKKNNQFAGEDGCYYGEKKSFNISNYLESSTYEDLLSKNLDARIFTKLSVENYCSG